MLRDGYKISASGLAPEAASETPEGAAARIERCSFKTPHLPVAYPPWITDMAIKAYQVSACLRKGLSHVSTHTHVKSVDENHLDVIKAEQQ